MMNTFKDAITKHNKSLANTKKAQISQFVDDSATWVTSKDPYEAVNRAQEILNVIEKWSKKYGFMINPKKTQVILFQRPNSKAHEKAPNFPKLTLCNQTLEYCEIAKFLGLLFDKYLTWNAHIESLKTRCQQDLNALKAIKGLKWGAAKQCLLNIYKGLILSKLNYGSVAFNSASPNILLKLQTIQNRALRIITGAPNHTNIFNLLAETAEIPLDLHREANMVKYWARSSRLGDKLPVNSKIKYDPLYSHRKNSHLTKPYVQKIRQLLQEYELNDINISPPTVTHTESLTEIYPDTGLTKIIDKSNLDPNSLNIVENYLTANYPGFTHIYTDGSKNQNENCGAGVIFMNKKSEVTDKIGLKLPKESSIFSCELLAITFALHAILETDHQNVIICTDSLSSLQAIQSGYSKSRPELLNKINKAIRDLEQANKVVKLVWVPSHIGLKGNEMADKEAKQASLNGYETNLPLSPREAYSIIKTKVKEKFKKRWANSTHRNKEFFDPLPTKLQSYSNKTFYDTAYTRLKLGASNLAGDRKGQSNDRMCNFCNKLEDIEHVFFECNKYKDQQNKLLSEILRLGPIVINSCTLFNPPKNLENQIRPKIFEFLSKTGLLNYNGFNR